MMSKQTKPSGSMMPWDGWFSRFLKEKLGPERFENLRSKVLWKKDDLWGLEQHPRPDTEHPISKDDPTMTSRFRHPSPGSTPQVNIPSTGDKGTFREDPYNIAYYPHDTRRRGTDRALSNPQLERERLEMMDPNDPDVKEAKEKLEKAIEEGPGSSPGNKGMFATGKSDFDPTGLRATMSTSYVATNKVLDSNFPSQIPLPNWYYRQEEILEWYKSRGLPIPLGGDDREGGVPVHGRIARW
jgi:hypothetical protein